jgi:hypothetical protein
MRIGPATAMLVWLSLVAFCNCSAMMYSLRMLWSSVLAEMGTSLQMILGSFITPWPYRVRMQLMSLSVESTRRLRGVDMTRSMLATISDAVLGAWRVIRRLFLNSRLMFTVQYPTIFGGTVPTFEYISTSLIFFKLIVNGYPVSCMGRQHLDSSSYLYATG